MELTKAQDMIFDSLDAQGKATNGASVIFAVKSSICEDMLDTAAPNLVRFIDKGSDYWGNGEAYTGSVVEYPSWLDVAEMAHDMIEKTDDRNHIYLEDIKFCGVDAKNPEINVYKFVMGS